MRLAALALVALTLAPTAFAHALPVPVALAPAHPAAATPPAPPATKAVDLRVPELVNVVAPGPGGRALAVEAGVPDYSITFSCPALPLGLLEDACPNRIVDGDDILGNPGLAVDPVVPGRIAFASLHGQAAERGPTPLARDGQTHTTFTTLAFGTNWEDQPYSPPSPPFDYGDERIVGLDVHALIDKSRALQIASLYAHRSGGDGSPWKYSIVTWKFDQESRKLDYNFISDVFQNEKPGGSIEAPTLVEVPAASSVVLTWLERGPPVSTDNATGAVANATVATAWLAAAVTTADAYSPWERLAPAALIAPCQDATNPVALDTHVLVACEAPDPLDPARNVTRLWTIDVSLRTATPGAVLPVSARHARLAATEDGDVAIVQVDSVRRPEEPKPQPEPEPPAANESGNGSQNATANRTRPATARLRDVRAWMSTSSDGGESWSRAIDIVDVVHNRSRNLTGARVTALLYSPDTLTLHMIVEEQASQADVEAGLPRWRKALVVTDPVGTTLLRMDLDLSDKGEVFFNGGPTEDPVYGDTRDSLIRVSGQEYIAFADYGVVVFAEITEHDERIVVDPVPQPAPPPEPVAILQASAVQTATGTFAGVVAAAAAARVVGHKMAAGAGKGGRK
ncbi:MAG TPA: hypothetical protein VHH36_06800 [Candidatus Thermoplasmatota archaeon]|nr:hypothetical protein [Candidatus Thermoplasmatota archaeon]